MNQEREKKCVFENLIDEIVICFDLPLVFPCMSLSASHQQNIFPMRYISLIICVTI